MQKKVEVGQYVKDLFFFFNVGDVAIMNFGCILVVTDVFFIFFASLISENCTFDM